MFSVGVTNHDSSQPNTTVGSLALSIKYSSQTEEGNVKQIVVFLVEVSNTLYLFEALVIQIFTRSGTSENAADLSAFVCN